MKLFKTTIKSLLLPAIFILILIGMGIAVFGYIPWITEPDQIQNTALTIVLSSALLFVFTYTAGIGKTLYERENLAGYRE